MKAYFLSAFLLLGISSFGQTTSSESRRFDLNGNPITAGSSSESKTQGDGRTVRTEYGVDTNGQKVPLASTEETKIEQDGRIVVQQIIRRFDQNGNLTSTERVVSNEQKLASGAIEKQTSVYRSDLNGNESLDERAVTQTEGKTSVTSVEKRAFDGSLELAERQTTTTEKNPSGSKSESSTFRKDSNGNLYEVVKQVQETKKQGNQTVENDSTYVVQGDGRYALQEQKVIRSTAKADGTVSKRIEVYGEQVPGTTNESGKPALKEIQTVESRKTADGSVVETKSSQKAEVTDNGRLTSPQVISETVIEKKANQ
jgi:hypothetical protein